MDWVRLYHEMPTDPKWRAIARRAGQRIGDVIATYTFILVNASCNAEKRGVTHNLNAEDIAAAIDLEEDGVTAILSAMEGRVVVNGQLLGWEKRNPKREDSSTERVRKHRETQCNAEKRPELEEDTDRPSSLNSDGSAQARPRKTKRSLPENFPLQADLTWAEELWLERGRADLCSLVAEEAAKFRDHHTAKASTSADWSASWRTWAQNAMKFSNGGFNGKRNNTAPKRSTTDQHLAGMAELVSDIRNGRG